MLMRKAFIALLLSATGPLWASTLRSDGSTLRLKSIVKNLGGDVLSGVVIDSNNLETKILLKESDAVEIKRGLWVLKAGDYQREI